MKRAALIFLFTLQIPLIFAEYAGRIDVELWCSTNPLVFDETIGFPVPKEKSLQILLEEARIIFSYMIYGAEFQFTPSDKSRKVTEEYTIKPLYEIEWGDVNMEIVSTRVEKDKLFAVFRYNLLEFMSLRIESWKSNNKLITSGSGTADFFKGVTYKQKSMENAVKEAVKNALQIQYYNKPRQIKGKILLMEAPLTIIKAGNYITKVKIKVNIDEITSYEFF